MMRFEGEALAKLKESGLRYFDVKQAVDILGIRRGAAAVWLFRLRRLRLLTAKQAPRRKSKGKSIKGGRRFLYKLTEEGERRALWYQLHPSTISLVGDLTPSEFLTTIPEDVRIAVVREAAGLISQGRKVHSHRMKIMQLALTEALSRNEGLLEAKGEAERSEFMWLAAAGMAERRASAKEGTMASLKEELRVAKEELAKLKQEKETHEELIDFLRKCRSEMVKSYDQRVSIQEKNLRFLRRLSPLMLYALRQYGSVFAKALRVGGMHVLPSSEVEAMQESIDVAIKLFLRANPDMLEESDKYLATHPESESPILGDSDPWSRFSAEDQLILLIAIATAGGYEVKSPAQVQREMLERFSGRASS